MCIYERIYNNWRNIIQTWIGIWAIYFAYVISEKQSEDIKIQSDIQKEMNEIERWKVKIDTIKFAIDWALYT